MPTLEELSASLLPAPPVPAKPAELTSMGGPAGPLPVNQQVGAPGPGPLQPVTQFGRPQPVNPFTRPLPFPKPTPFGAPRPGGLKPGFPSDFQSALPFGGARPGSQPEFAGGPQPMQPVVAPAPLPPPTLGGSLSTGITGEQQTTTERNQALVDLFRADPGALENFFRGIGSQGRAESGMGPRHVKDILEGLFSERTGGKTKRFRRGFLDARQQFRDARQARLGRDEGPVPAPTPDPSAPPPPAPGPPPPAPPPQAPAPAPRPTVHDRGGFSTGSGNPVAPRPPAGGPGSNVPPPGQAPPPPPGQAPPQEDPLQTAAAQGRYDVIAARVGGLVGNPAAWAQNRLASVVSAFAPLDPLRQAIESGNQQQVQSMLQNLSAQAASGNQAAIRRLGMLAGTDNRAVLGTNSPVEAPPPVGHPQAPGNPGV